MDMRVRWILPSNTAVLHQVKSSVLAESTASAQDLLFLCDDALLSKFSAYRLRQAKSTKSYSWMQPVTQKEATCREARSQQ